MVVVLFVILLVGCLVAPWLGTDTSDARSVRAHPQQGCYPALPTPRS